MEKRVISVAYLSLHTGLHLTSMTSSTASIRTLCRSTIWELIQAELYRFQSPATILNNWPVFLVRKRTSLRSPGPDRTLWFAIRTHQCRNASIMLLGLGGLAFLRFSALRGKSLPASAAL